MPAVPIRRVLIGTGRVLATMLLTLLALSVVIFGAINIVPIDAARANLGRSATDEQLAIYRDEFHLDDPLTTRYVAWLGDIAHGDFGTSLAARQPVSTLIGDAIGPSLMLAVASMALATVFGVGLGVLAGRRPGSRADRAISGSMLVGAAFPPFSVAILLIVVFGAQLGWLPVDSTAVAYSSGWDEAKAYVLPAVTLAISIAPYIGRMVRSSVSEAMSAPFVRAARLRGIPERRLLWRHVVPVAIGPSLSVVALNLAELLVGLVVIEQIFGFPGLGKLLVDAVGAGDVPLVQAIVLLSGAAYIVANQLSDVGRTALDPRLRDRQ